MAAKYLVTVTCGRRGWRSLARRADTFYAARDYGGTVAVWRRGYVTRRVGLFRCETWARTVQVVCMERARGHEVSFEVLGSSGWDRFLGGS